MKRYHLVGNNQLIVSNQKWLIAYTIIISFSAIMLFSCSSANGSKENYFGYNNNPNKGIRSSSEAVPSGESIARGQVYDVSGKEEGWKNPLSDDYISSGKINDSDSHNSDAEQKQIVNYYFYNTYPHYVPVSIPWWWGGFGWYRFSFPRIYLYVGTPWYWWDYYWNDWYAPWYDFHPYYGLRWSYYNDYWDWHYYHYHHNYWDWDYYCHRHYPYYSDDREYKKRSVRKFGPNRNINVADNDIDINGSRSSSLNDKVTSRTNKVIGSRGGNLVKDLKPVGKDLADNTNVSFDRSNDVFKTPVAVTGENPVRKDIAVEKTRSRIEEKSNIPNSNYIPIKGPDAVFKEAASSSPNIIKDNKAPDLPAQNQRTKINLSDKKAESFRFTESKDRVIEKAPSYIDYNNYNKPVERKRNTDYGERERKVENKSSESGFLKAIEGVFESFGSSSSSNNSSSSESSRSRSSSGSNESSRSSGSYSSPSSSGSSGSSGSSRSSGSGSSGSSNSERSRKAR